jgi:class 3 adenylate cyclase
MKEAPAELGRLVRDDLATLLSERFAASAQPIDPGSLPPPHPPITGLPTGTVTFLFSDIEGSTRLVQDLSDGYGAVRDAYAAIMRRAAEEGGVEVSTAGDSFFVAFASPVRAVEAADGAPSTGPDGPAHRGGNLGRGQLRRPRGAPGGPDR